MNEETKDWSINYVPADLGPWGVKTVCSAVEMEPFKPMLTAPGPRRIEVWAFRDPAWVYEGVADSEDDARAIMREVRRYRGTTTRFKLREFSLEREVEL